MSASFIGSQYTNSFTLGTDQSITIQNNQTGAQVTLDGKRSMMSMDNSDVLVKSDTIDGGGVVDHRVVGDGWAGTIEVEKQNASFSALVSYLDANYYAGGSQQYFTIMETINLPGGQGTEYNSYIDCVFHGYKPGSWQKKNATKVTISVACAQRINIIPGNN
jgi:hypothetical protein